MLDFSTYFQDFKHILKFPYLCAPTKRGAPLPRARTAFISTGSLHEYMTALFTLFFTCTYRLDTWICGTLPTHELIFSALGRIFLLRQLAVILAPHGTPERLSIWWGRLQQMRLQAARSEAGHFQSATTPVHVRAEVCCGSRQPTGSLLGAPKHANGCRLPWRVLCMDYTLQPLTHL